MMDVIRLLVENGTYMDDRNFRGTIQQLIHFDTDLHECDMMAGHATQPDQTEIAVVYRNVK